MKGSWKRHFTKPRQITPVTGVKFPTFAQERDRATERRRNRRKERGMGVGVSEPQDNWC